MSFFAWDGKWRDQQTNKSLLQPSDQNYFFLLWFLESVLVRGSTLIWRRPWQLVVTALNAWSSSSTLLFDSWVIQSTSGCHRSHISIDSTDFSWLKVLRNLFHSVSLHQCNGWTPTPYSISYFCFKSWHIWLIGIFDTIHIGKFYPTILTCNTYCTIACPK